MNQLAEQLYLTLTKLTDCRQLCVAYSGGVDSHVLLEALAEARNADSSLQISAIHIDHRIHENSAAWAKHCQKICAALKIPCQIETIDIQTFIARTQLDKKKKISLETAARHLRYEALKRLVPKGAALLTAHHADDQAETLLLQLLRGAGPKGLAAIPTHSMLGGTELLRPMLQFSRQEIFAEAKARKLQWIEDESNLDISFERNYLRQKIIPELKLKWPGMLKTLGRASANCYETYQLAEDLAKQDYEIVCINHEPKSESCILDGAKLTSLSAIRQRNVLRYWLEHLQLPMPSRIKLEEIQRALLPAARDAAPLVAWHGAEIRRYQNKLYAMSPLPPHDNTQIFPWQITAATTSFTLPNGLGILHASFSAQAPKTISISIHFRQGGERFRPRGNAHSRSLKHLMQEWSIPPWLRDRVPLIYIGDKLASVVNYAVSEEWPKDAEIVWVIKD